MITKYGATPEQTSKTASGAPGKKELKPPSVKPEKKDNGKTGPVKQY